MDPLEKLNNELPKFFESAKEQRKALEQIEPMLNKFKEQIEKTMTIVEQKEGVYNGQQVRMKLFSNGEISIRFAKPGQGKIEINKIK